MENIPATVSIADSIMPFLREVPPRADADLVPLDADFFEPPPDCADLELVFFVAVPPEDVFAFEDRALEEAFVFELPVFEPEEDFLPVLFEADDPRPDELLDDDFDPEDDPAADLDLPAFDAAADLVDVDLDDDDFDDDDFFEPDFAEPDFEVEDFFVVAIFSFLRLVLFLKNLSSCFLQMMCRWQCGY